MIGFFDSGIGGLTIEQEVRKQLPEYSTLYLGDSARAPYGDRSHAELVTFAWQGIQWLFQHGAELVILACNSASASALREIQQEKLGPHPARRVLGVIRPTVEALAALDVPDVAVLSTEATKKSQAYAHEFQKLKPGVRVTSFACPTWAPLIEAGKAGSPEMQQQVEEDLAKLKKEDPSISAVLLACTHYPYVKTLVEEFFGASVPVFDQGPLVAASLADYLKRHPDIETRLDQSGSHSYFTTGEPEQATHIAQSTFGFSVSFHAASLEAVDSSQQKG